jgi:hypothetical protein
MFTPQVNPPLRGPGFSRAAANARPPARQSSNPATAPIQFTLEDAQRKWAQWYKTADVSKEKIEKYIAAKKRGWRMLNTALLRKETEMEDVGPEDPEVLPFDQGQDEEQEELYIHDEDVEMVKDIQDKQSERVSDKGRKHETDLRKHASAKYFASSVSGEQLTPFGLFFAKNSPPGYNRSVETEDETYEYQFDPHYDRDFTFPLTEELSTERREKTDYFRATAAHKHVRREKMDNQLRKIIVGQEPAKKSQINSRQVYMSFDVQIFGNQLKVVSAQGNYKNIKMLGAGTDSQIVKRKIDVSGRSLTIWINTKSAGHQSRYNASAIVPNFIQYTEIIRALEAQPVTEIEPEGEAQEKEFHPDTIEAALDIEREAPVNNYKKRLLADRKELISLVSAAINTAVENNYIKAIAVSKASSFDQYPCLILQPMESYVRDFKVEKGGEVDQLKRDIVFTLHEKFDFSFANRPSFGFANPTVGDVGTAVRIWPGLIDRSLFSAMMFKTLYKAGLLKNRPAALESSSDQSKNAPLVEALGIAILRASERYTRYKKIKEEGRELRHLQAMYDWILNRITSNVFKAEKLIELLKERSSDLEVNKRAVRTLENLNEYDLLQAGVEEQAHQREDRNERAGALLDAFRKPVLDKKFGGWKIIAVKIRSSGMDAYRAALELIGDARQDSARLYFETAKVNREIATRPEGLHKLGSITKMMDPSYNFVSHEDITTKKPYEWEAEKGYPTVHVYDITNTTLEDAFGKIGDKRPDFVLFFESLSKHFQLGMDKSTIGRLIVYMNEATRDQGRASTIKMKAEETKDTPMPHYALNYLGLQSRYYGV